MSTLIEAPDLISHRTVEGLPGCYIILAEGEEGGYRVTAERHGDHLFTIHCGDEAAAAEAYAHPFALRPASAPDPWGRGK